MEFEAEDDFFNAENLSLIKAFESDYLQKSQSYPEDSIYNGSTAQTYDLQRSLTTFQGENKLLRLNLDKAKNENETLRENIRSISRRLIQDKDEMTAKHSAELETIKSSMAFQNMRASDQNSTHLAECPRNVSMKHLGVLKSLLESKKDVVDLPCIVEMISEYISLFQDFQKFEFSRLNAYLKRWICVLLIDDAAYSAAAEFLLNMYQDILGQSSNIATSWPETFPLPEGIKLARKLGSSRDAALLELSVGLLLKAFSCTLSFDNKMYEYKSELTAVSECLKSVNSPQSSFIALPEHFFDSHYYTPKCGKHILWRLSIERSERQATGSMSSSPVMRLSTLPPRQVLWEEPYTIQKDLTSSHIHQIIRQNVETYFGDLGVASLAQCLTVKYFDCISGIGILRTSRQHFRSVWASFTMATQLSKKTCRIRPLHLSGTLRSAQLVAIRLLRNELKSCDPKKLKYASHTLSTEAHCDTQANVIRKISE